MIQFVSGNSSALKKLLTPTPSFAPRPRSGASHNLLRLGLHCVCRFEEWGPCCRGADATCGRAVVLTLTMAEIGMRPRGLNHGTDHLGDASSHRNIVVHSLGNILQIALDRIVSTQILTKDPFSKSTYTETHILVVRHLEGLAQHRSAAE